uniref:Ggy family antimicrobial peptide n=1 Tax=Anopheles dirus TaxID=7168 RepID=A0A182NJ11_9DIPT
MASFKVTLFFALVALCAIVSAIPAPQQPAAARQAIEPRPVAAAGSLDAADELEAGADDKDLKGASSFGYGYYGYPGYYGYGGYPGYAYSYGWGRYPYYRYGGLYGGYWY